MARVLLRARLGVKSSWPAPPAANLFEPPWQGRILEAWGKEVVTFHDPPLPAISAEPVKDLTWRALRHADLPYFAFSVDGGNRQDQHRLRRWVDEALAYFEADPQAPPTVRIRRLDAEREAEVTATEIIFASRLFRERNPQSEIRLGMRAHIFVADCLLYRAGVPSTDIPGMLAHGILRGWVRQKVFVGPDGIPEKLLTHQPISADDPNFFLIGEHLGSAAAGNETSAGILGTWLNAIDADAELRSWVESKAGINMASTGREMLDAIAADYRSADKEESG